MKDISTIKELFEDSLFGSVVTDIKSKKSVYANRFIEKQAKKLIDKVDFSVGETELFDESGNKWYRTFTEEIIMGERKFLHTLYFDITDLKTASKEMSDRDKELEIVSTTDKLTKLFNRHKLIETISSELAKSARYRRKFSLIMLDVDDLSKVNSDFGQKAGDMLIVEFSKFLNQNTREVDILGRWEGGQMMIICPETDINGAINMAEKLRIQIEEAEFSNVEKITASFGVTGHLNGDDEDSIVKRVQNGLEGAKNNGKNRVEFELI